MCNHSIRTFRWCISYFTCWSKLESCFIDSVKSSPVIAAQPATAVNRSLTRLQKTQLPLFHRPTGSIPRLLIMTGQTDTMILCRTAPPTVIIRGCKILFWHIKPHISFSIRSIFNPTATSVMSCSWRLACSSPIFPGIHPTHPVDSTTPWQAINNICFCL